LVGKRTSAVQEKYWFHPVKSMKRVPEFVARVIA
jgi:hypothetical protein